MIPVRFNKENYFPSKFVLGRGQFAISYMYGKIVVPDSTIVVSHPFVNTPVLFKSVTNSEDEKCFKALIHELNILEFINHSSILNLVGACINELKNREIFLAFEMCSFGNLLKFLRHCDPLVEYDSYRPIITHTEGGPVLTLTRSRLLQWSFDIVNGMEYLASKSIVHNDLAARNVLVTDQWKMKICNFGLSQKLSSGSTTCSAPHNLPKEFLPIKWMAPEAIQSLRYSEQSDVWSFGITLWEIYTVGDIPYRDIEVNKDFHRTLLDRRSRLAKPIYATSDIWALITPCWEFIPERRPKFSRLKMVMYKLITAEKSVLTKIEQRNRRQMVNTLLKDQISAQLHQQ